jgi:hypothetical protein
MPGLLAVRLLSSQIDGPGKLAVAEAAAAQRVMARAADWKTFIVTARLILVGGGVVGRRMIAK